MQRKQYILAKRNLKLKINEAFVGNYPELSSGILVSMNITLFWKDLAYE